MNYALLIGNTLYDDPTLKRLKAPDADLRELAKVLHDSTIGGYQVQTALNESLEQVQSRIGELFADKQPDDLLLLYFSGHGVLDPQGRLCLAVRATLSQRPRTSGIRADLLKDEMDDSRARRQALILDCCHSGAFGAGRKGSDALGQPAVLGDTFRTQGRGRVVLTATDKTSAAWEGEQIIGGLENSLFTHFLIEGLRTGVAADEQGRVTVAKLYDYVYQCVTSAAPHQKPRLFADDQEGQIVIARAQPPAPKAKPLPPELVEALTNPQIFVREGAVMELGRLLKGPDPALAQAARQKLEAVRDDDAQPRRVYEAALSALAVEAETKKEEAKRVAPQKSEKAKQSVFEKRLQELVDEQKQITRSLTLNLAPGVTLELMRVPAGEFLMGSDKAKDKDAYHDETPQHELYLPEYLMGKTPVTVAQFAAFVKATNYQAAGEDWNKPNKADHPVTDVSWHDAIAFCDWASQTTGRKVLLPSEAEWEKAARGADGHLWPWGNEPPTDKHCNFDKNVHDTTPVGQYSPKGDSPYGCVDMAGNVWEWTRSKRVAYPYVSDDGREVIDDSGDWCVVRGGAEYNSQNYIRAACRYTIRYDSPGFRVCVLPNASRGRGTRRY